MNPDGMKPVFNFCSGPAMLPPAVLVKAQEELRNYQGSGMSVMEMSHRSETMGQIFSNAETSLRELVGIPDDYAVLFLQGGASLQFSAVPMNLFKKGVAGYVLTGVWSKKAAKEAKHFGEVTIVATDEVNHFTQVPALSDWKLDASYDYLHLTPNETIHGVEFSDFPDTQGVPVVADMSSTLLSRPIDVERYGLIYAGAQKNIGPAGLTLVIIRKDLLKVSNELAIPSLMRYDEQAKAASMINTPPTFSVYLAGLVFEWLKEQGGLSAMAQHNEHKAQLLYDFLDDSTFYHNPVKKADRSWMNVPFVLRDERLDAPFLKAADEHRLYNLKGHRSVGGMRASLYNAMSLAGVEALIDFLKAFEKQKG